ncbi:ABC-2 type transport system permease protein [Pseudobutyrivibrio sp. YE44]|uniref:hypothetical protein n=1 Tax=Pseudobutyrivibrio sp. YE44 TaxID=1520802 RepID=UPI00088B2D18|nr:hypothetical protein [Pseudobutyrivibrio sp. YE44]SDB37933.1 ABC-2 type transport system permease protein [Pseudobutyrivibrio sp. YE44]
MQSKTSFFNMTLFKKNISRTWIAGLVYFIILILSLPVTFIISNANAADDYMADMGYTMEMRLYQHMSVVPTASFAMVMSIIVTAITFWYLFSKRDNYMMHSFPVNRASLFFTGILSSMVVTLLPVLVTAILMTGVAVGMGTASVSCIWYWTIIVVVSTILFTSIAMFSLMTTGQMVTAILFYFTFNFLYLLMELAFRLTASALMFGMGQALTGITFKIWSPIMFIPVNTSVTSDIQTDDYGSKVIGFTHSFDGAQYLLIYFIAALVIIAISFMMYKKKKLETVQDFISVPWLKPVFSVGMSFFISMVAGASAASMLEVFKPFSFNVRYIVAIIFITVIGIVIFYATQMMIEKTLRVFSVKTLSKCLGYTVAALVVILGLRLDVFKIEDKVPAEKNIEWAAISGEYTMVFQDQKNIKQVRELHKNFLEDKKELRDVATLFPEDGTSTLDIKYKLKNGDVIVRSYDVINTEAKDATATYVAATQPILDFVNKPEIIKEHVIGNTWNTGFIKEMTFSTYIYDDNVKDFVYDSNEFVNLTDKEKREKYERVYKALLKDVDEGKVFVQKFGYDEDDASISDNQLYNDFYFTIRDEKNIYISDLDLYWGEQFVQTMYEQDISVALTRDCKNVLKALKDEEFYDDDDKLVTYGEYNKIMGYNEDESYASY